MSTIQVFFQNGIPIKQQDLFVTENAAKEAIIGTLNIQCDENGFIYNANYESEKVSQFNEKYENDQSHSQIFCDYMENLSDYLLLHFINKNDTIVEIGCGQGQFSKLLAKKLPNGRVYGFDTAYREQNNGKLKNLFLYNEYYSEKHKDIIPNVIICRHVFEYIEQPLEFLKYIYMECCQKPDFYFWKHLTQNGG